MDELKADQVLQEKAKSLPNVEIFVSSQTTEVVGNGDKVTGIRTKDRKTGEERVIHLDGIFVQIGLAANSGVFKEIVETNRPGEIVIDAHCRTNVLVFMQRATFPPYPLSKSLFLWEKAPKRPFRPLKIGYVVYSVDEIPTNR